MISGFNSMMTLLLKSQKNMLLVKESEEILLNLISKDFQTKILIIHPDNYLKNSNKILQMLIC